jgi:hypothetical protein
MYGRELWRHYFTLALLSCVLRAEAFVLVASSACAVALHASGCSHVSLQCIGRVCLACAACEGLQHNIHFVWGRAEHDEHLVIQLHRRTEPHDAHAGPGRASRGTARQPHGLTHSGVMHAGPNCRLSSHTACLKPPCAGMAVGGMMALPGVAEHADGLEACQRSWCFTYMQQSSWHSSLSEPHDAHQNVHAYNTSLLGFRSVYKQSVLSIVCRATVD